MNFLNQKPVANADNGKLKMRAERFGETVSKTLHDVSIFYISNY